MIARRDLDDAARIELAFVDVFHLGRSKSDALQAAKGWLDGEVIDEATCEVDSQQKGGRKECSEEEKF